MFDILHLHLHTLFYCHVYFLHAPSAKHPPTQAALVDLNETPIVRPSSSLHSVKRKYSLFILSFDGEVVKSEWVLLAVMQTCLW